jgi:hypothetical protein
MPSKECHMAKGNSVRYLKLTGSWEKVICGCQLASWGIKDLGLIRDPCIVFAMAWSPDLHIIHVLLYSSFLGQESVRCRASTNVWIKTDF